MTRLTCIGKTGWTLIVILAFALTYTVSAVSGPNTAIIVTKDSRTKEGLGNTQVYLDGGYRGATSPADEGSVLLVQEIGPGTHTLRTTRPGYKDLTRKFVYPAETTVEVMMAKGSLVSLDLDGPAPGGIDIVFYPSSTSYNCAEHAVVSSPLYMTNETRFRDDVMRVIRSTYLELGTVTSPSALPGNFTERFNFYYYYDPSSPADAFSGCAGTVPEKYWDEVPFSDITVILYPSYQGLYADPSCQPTGCFVNSVPGRNLMKAPADQLMLFRHETGHAVFGLVDTYCGDTYYYQNEPHPNVWASQDSCRTDAQSNNRDPGECRQIRKDNSSLSSCSRNYWQWDPSPDIMASGYGGRFGDAATQWISYVLSGSGGPGP